jgi:ABC-type glycerol-3-phosphate transport system substrate-binding protein
MKCRLYSTFFVLFMMVLAFFHYADFLYKKDNRPILFFHWMPGKQLAFEKMSQKFFEETGLKVQFEHTSQTEQYQSQVLDSIHRKIKIDIFGLLASKREIADLIHEGAILNLESTYTNLSLKSALDPIAIEGLEFKKSNPFHVHQGIYGVPLEIHTFAVFYNKTILSKYGLNSKLPPKNFSDLLKIQKVLKSKEIQDFSFFSPSQYLTEAFYMNVALNTLDSSLIYKTFLGNFSYNSPEWIKVFELIRALGSFSLDQQFINNENQAEKDFLSGNLAMIYSGSWFLNILKNTRPDLDFGVFLLPPNSSEIDKVALKAPGSIFYINNESNAKLKAIDFLKWLVLPSNAMDLAQQSDSISSVTSAQTIMNPEMANALADTDRFINPFLLIEQENSYITEMIFIGVRKLLKNEITAQELAQSLANAQFQKSR